MALTSKFQIKKASTEVEAFSMAIDLADCF